MTDKQPTVTHMLHVLFPVLKQMGVNIDYKVLEHGFFPDVIGCVQTKIKALAPGSSL